MKPDDKKPFWSGLAWGAMEGTWLPVVPDILLCYWAMKSLRHSVVATLAVVLGAEVAAVLLYTVLPLGDLAQVLPRWWGILPGFEPKMAEVAAGHLALNGGSGLLEGPTSGIPYRAYLVEAWQAKIPLWEILVWTPLARLERIVIAPIAVLVLRWLIVGKLAPRFGGARIWTRLLTGLIIVYWIGLYVWYWGFFVPTTYGVDSISG
jgi:hypothetical protein